ncbi:M23 family metallopeptidase [Accumulibacter sp.]|uniref:M23 family metallopeptidase n=1 Tax=Accumulibacter sp. TaxID=2053492 RepID=UPI0028C3B4C7|nr:M23 family metallopeptidase [Accumulibacter sp.]
MHLILVSNRLATAKTLTITPRLLLLLMFGFLALVVSTSFAFSSLRLSFHAPVSDSAPALAEESDKQDARDFARGSLNAMATKLGEMQAQLLRLDSLGERISRIYGVPAPEKSSKGGQGGPLIIDLSSPSEPELLRALEHLDAILEQRSDSLTALESQLLEQRIRSSLLPTLLPIDGGRVGSRFGLRIDPVVGVRARHEGMDFVADPGTRVAAAGGGVVLATEFHPEYGNLVDIDHGNELSSRYAHLARIDVKPGQVVRRGEQIGVSGNTGRTTGPHLHFEVRFKGVAQNPERFFRHSLPLAAQKVVPNKNGS